VEIPRQAYVLIGKPVDEAESVDFVPSIFSYNQHQHKSEAQSRERRNRIDRRRLVVEVSEADKENKRQAEE
jgi:hypothetical protein